MHKARALTAASIMMLIMILVLTAVGADEFATEPKAAKISISSQAPAKETSQPPNITQTTKAGRQSVSDIGSSLTSGADKGVMAECGDVNDDGFINIGDMTYLVDYLYQGGDSPPMLEFADVDDCGSINAADIMYLIAYIFLGGPPPECGAGGRLCYLPTGGNSVDLGCPITIDTPDGDSVAIPIYFTNDTPIRALSLGFHHNSSDVEITSVSFDAAVLPTGYQLGAKVDTDSNSVLIYWHELFTDLSPQSGGLLATMWAQVPVSTPSQTIDIDSAFVGPGGEFIFCPASGGAIEPAYNDCGTADIVVISPTQDGEDIGSAFPITSLPFTDQGTTIGRIDDYYEFCPYEGEGAPDVVYSYQPAVPELVTISLCDDYTDYDTKLFVYAGDPSILTACNDDASACTDYKSQIECQPLSPDTIYYIVVDGYVASEGNYQIDMFVDDNCGPCEVTCPPGGVAEAEPCGDDANGGCNMAIPAFEPISNNQTVCGTIFADGGSRDTDWYELVLETECTVTWTGSAEFPVRIGSCTRIAGPGTYWLFVSSQDFYDYPCGTDNDYWAEVQTTLLPSDYVRVGTDSIPAGTQGYELKFFWERTCPNPATIYGASNGFEFTTTGAASFTFVDIIPFPEHMDWFNLGGLLFTNSLPDWFLVGGAAMPPMGGMPVFAERDYFTLVLDIGSGEGQICIDSAFVGAAGQWAWSGLTCGQGGAPDRPLFLAADSSNTQHPICITVYNPAICGDADGSGAVDIDDVVFLITYIFAGGPPPVPLESGDANCEGGIDIDDVVYLISYIFAGGPAPCDPNGDTVPDC